MIKIILRRLTHKTDEKKIGERYILNTVYESEKHNLLLYPIPEFVEPKCSCGNVGFAVMFDFKVYCKNCINNILGNTKVVQEKVLIVPSVDQAVKGNAFEWQIQGKDEWYKIKGVGITWDSTQRLSVVEIKRRWDEIMYQVVSDNPQLVDADYIKEEKKLIVFV
jgi:hypothetical protein